MEGRRKTGNEACCTLFLIFPFGISVKTPSSLGESGKSDAIGPRVLAAPAGWFDFSPMNEANGEAVESLSRKGGLRESIRESQGAGN